MLSDLNSTRMLLLWEVMTSGISEPQNLPCSLASGDRPLRTSTKSYLQTYKTAWWGALRCSHGSSPESLQDPFLTATPSARFRGSVLSTPTGIPLAQGVDMGALTQSTLGVGELYLGLG